LDIFQNHNINYARIRIWHTPAAGYYNLEQTLQLAGRIKALGMGLLIDFHYSDTWADPGHQTKPAAWENLSFAALQDSIYQYSYRVIKALSDQNTPPDMVQIGNEIICGLLWDEGRVCGDFNTTQQWSQLAALINEGIRGTEDGLRQDDSVQIMIHIDRGGDNGGCRWFFDNLISQNVTFDIIGLSFYPWWHGTLTDLQANINDLGQRYNKDIIVVETSYPWTLDWNDDVGNVVGDSSQLHPGYPATVEGQTAFLSDLINVVRDVPNNRGLGIFYWEPAWISTPQEGSRRENLALFDFSGELLASISAFDSNYTSITHKAEDKPDFLLYQNHPNPFNPKTVICYRLSANSHIELNIYDIQGKRIVTLFSGIQTAGIHRVEWDVSGKKDLASGVYIYRLRTNKGLVQSRKLILLR